MGMSHEALRSTMGALDDRKSGQYRSASIRSVCISQFGDAEKMKSQGLWEQCLSLMAAMQSSEIAPNEMLVQLVFFHGAGWASKKTSMSHGSRSFPSFGSFYP